MNNRTFTLSAAENRALRPMKISKPYRIAVAFPGELEYIPLVRKLVSDVLAVMNFSPKFTFRSELIVDELCNNAVCYGASIERSSIEIVCEVFNDKVDFTVKDPGGTRENVNKLQEAITAELPIQSNSGDSGHGMELVRMLAENISCSVDGKNMASIHIVRKREDLD
jgi:anti-sigma regulatory factor (Ser/Thr protein kinase)